MLKNWYRNNNFIIKEQVFLEPGTLIKLTTLSTQHLHLRPGTYGMVLRMKSQMTSKYWAVFDILINDTIVALYAYEFEPCHQ